MIKNYPPKSYKSPNYDSSPQNWSFAIDSEGKVFVGNSTGILVYDGVGWDMIPSTQSYLMNQVAVSKDQRIFVGGLNEFGELRGNGSGHYAYQSFLPFCEGVDASFGEIKRIEVFDHGIAFCAEDRVFWYLENEMVREVKLSSEVFRFNRVENALWYIPRFSGKREYRIYGVDTIRDHILEGLPDPIAESVMGIGKGNEDTLIFTGKRHGLFLWGSGGRLEQDKETALFLSKLRQFAFVRLKGGKFAIGNLTGGVVIVDSHGKIQTSYTLEDGLIDDIIISVFEDRNGYLWLGLNSGVARVSGGGALRKIEDSEGEMVGIIEGFATSNGLLFVRTNDGFFKIKKRGGVVPGLDIKNIGGGISNGSGLWEAHEFGDEIFVASDVGSFRIFEEDIERVFPDSSRILCPSYVERDAFWWGTPKGVKKLKHSGEEWQEEKDVLEVPGGVEKIIEDKDGNLWVTSPYDQDLFLVRPSGESIAFDENHFPEGITVKLPYLFDGEIRIGTRIGVLRFDWDQKRFLHDSTFSSFFIDGKNEFRNLVKDENGRFWVSSGNLVGAIKENSIGIWDWDSTTLARIPSTDIWSIYPYQDELLLATTDGVFVYDHTKRPEKIGSALVRKVIVGGDSVLFNGVFSDSTGRIVSFQPRDFIPSLEPNLRSIQFHFALPFFEREEETQYSFKLENYDDAWSPWTSETKTNFTNLSPGSYVFRVRAKNVYEQISEEGTYAFRIGTPWYATFWAYILYALIAAGLVYLIVFLNARRLRRKNLMLEQTIQDRTTEIREQKDQLEVANVQLKEAKDRAEQSEAFMEQFLANMSHEIRTPMNAVMGMTHLLLDTKLNEKQAKYLNTIKFASDNLLVIINDILDLTKIEVGQMTLESIPFKLQEVASGVLATVQLKAEEKGIRLLLDYDDSIPQVVMGDPYRLNQILLNLVNNAIKFTETGFVRLSLFRLQSDGKKAMIRFQVEDTGIGIPEEKLASIFDSFRQASSDTTRKYGGTGLGLTISKHLVELQGGQIDVESEVDDGTTFGFNLQMQVGTTDQLEAEQPLKSLSLSGELPPIRLLLVDDDAFNREVGRETLLNWHSGIEIELAENGKEAVEKVKNGAFDIVLMDMQMPEMDGLEATAAIREMPAPEGEVPIVALTAHASRKERERCLQNGMQEYLTKPFIPQELFSTILQLIPDAPEIVSSLPGEEKVSTPGVAEAGVLDLGMLKGITGDDPQRLLSFLEMFERLAEEEWKNIQEAKAGKNWDEMRAAAHKLKGKAGYFGLMELQELMAELQVFEEPENNQERLEQIISSAGPIISAAKTEIQILKPKLN